jgi:hypothetical protein
MFFNTLRFLVSLALLGIANAKIQFAGIITHGNEEFLFRKACRALVDLSNGLSTEMCARSIDRIPEWAINYVKDHGAKKLANIENIEVDSVSFLYENPLFWVFLLSVFFVFVVPLMESKSKNSSPKPVTGNRRKQIEYYGDYLALRPICPCCGDDSIKRNTCECRFSGGGG